MDFEIRQATIDDIPEITSLFRNTIININSRDYSDKQIKVWASGADDIEKWEKRINNEKNIKKIKKRQNKENLF